MYDEWIVVCEELHIAIGPFDSWEKAERDAIKETKAHDGGCTYHAVKFIRLKPKEKPPTHEKDRGYL